MRPPRMGVGSLGYQKSHRQSQPIRNAKGNSCASERYSQHPQNLSLGSIGTNETKSSHDESIDKADSVDIKLNCENTEPEPEWFSWPASRHDVIDLHGFDDEEALKENSETSSGRNSPKKIGFDEFTPRNQRQAPEPLVASQAYRLSSYNQPTRNNNQRRSYNNPGSNNYNSRYRNPLHQSYDSSMNSSSSDAHNYSGHNVEYVVNPFFDAWKRKTESISNWNGNASQMPTIADVENAMRQQRNAFQQQHQAYGLPYGGNPAVPQFFQNAAASTSQNRMAMAHQMPQNGRQFTYDNLQPGSIPTPEQLQQHTSEIMRNAIMRKQFQNRKFP